MGAINLSGNLVSVAGNYGSELQDDTVFGDTTRSRAGGLKTVQLQIEGYYEAANPDSTLFSNVGLAGVPVTVGSLTGAEDEVAHSFLANFANYSPGGSIGEMLKFSAEAEASGGDTGLIKGYIGYNGTASSTSSTTGQQIGAVSAGQKLYGALHVIGFNGAAPTLDVKIQSDDNSGFTSATDRITFTQATAATSEWAPPVAGAITDDYWRINYTLGGTITDVTFVVFLGIQ